MEYSGTQRAKPQSTVSTILRLDLAACEDIVAGGELALGVALEQQGLDFGGGPVSQEDEGGGRRGDNGRGHGGLGHGTGLSGLSHRRPGLSKRVLGLGYWHETTWTAGHRGLGARLSGLCFEQACALHFKSEYASFPS